MVSTYKQKKSGKKIFADILFWVVAFATMGALFFYLRQGWQAEVVKISPYIDVVILSLSTLIIAQAIQKFTIFMITKFTPNTQRSQTIKALLCSVIKYLIGIVTLILILIFVLGEEYINTLFAGVGVLALIIGLGCQSLIGDIVAGIFMVFEGQFQVGDVIVVEGWRGTVKEIGLRTTSVEDIGGNVQIINNSQINKVVNNSKALSAAVCDVGIEYGESLEFVEGIIQEHLPLLKSKINNVLDGPFYLGVESLADSAVILRIVAHTKENDKFQVQRDLKRQVKLLFDKHNINIPFNQITVSNLSKSPARKISKPKKVATASAAKSTAVKPAAKVASKTTIAKQPAKPAAKSAPKTTKKK